MNGALALAATFAVNLALGTAWAAEPLLGTWHLDRQEVNGVETKSGPLTLKISQSEDKLTFAFSVPENSTYMVRMTYTLQLDGSEAEVKNAQGDRVGTIQMTRNGVSQYKFVLKGPNRPDSSGTIMVSPDGKTLTSEAGSVREGRPTHSRQVFLRD